MNQMHLILIGYCDTKLINNMKHYTTWFLNLFIIQAPAGYLIAPDVETVRFLSRLTGGLAVAPSEEDSRNKSSSTLWHCLSIDILNDDK
jgi:hypothetical protein